jgi:hypothetical protein
LVKTFKSFLFKHWGIRESRGMCLISFEAWLCGSLRR